MRGSRDCLNKGFVRSELRTRQRRAALVVEAYIVATPANCQLGSRGFFELFATASQPPYGRCVMLSRRPIFGCGASAVALIEPYCGPIAGGCLAEAMAAGAALLARAFSIWLWKFDRDIGDALAFVDFIRRGRQLSLQQKKSR